MFSIGRVRWDSKVSEERKILNASVVSVSRLMLVPAFA